MSAASPSAAPRRAASATAGPRSPAEADIATSWPSGSRISSRQVRRSSSLRQLCMRALALLSRVGRMSDAEWVLVCWTLVMVRYQGVVFRAASPPSNTLAGAPVSHHVACDLDPSALLRAGRKRMRRHASRKASCPRCGTVRKRHAHEFQSGTRPRLDGLVGSRPQAARRGRSNGVHGTDEGDMVERAHRFVRGERAADERLDDDDPGAEDRGQERKSCRWVTSGARGRRVRAGPRT